MAPAVRGVAGPCGAARRGTAVSTAGDENGRLRTACANPAPGPLPARFTPQQGDRPVSFVTTPDGVEIFYKDWGPKDARPVVFHHGWPLSADDWDAQLLFFLARGYRVVAHDRRGH